MMVTLLAGCGNFEWFPQNSAFTNHSTASSSVTQPGTVMRELPFPATVKWVSDISYDKSNATFWLLAWTGLAIPPNAPNALVKINATTGAYISKVDASSWPFTILDGSTLAYDGSFFWITSNGSNSGVVASEVYQIRWDGSYSNTYPCLSTSTGFCRGVAFDAATSSYWTAGSDTANLVNYQVAGSTYSSSVTYSNNLYSGASDVAFDSATNEVFVVNNGIVRVNKSSGAYLSSIPFTLPGTGRGDWDGTYLWVVDNSSKSIKALFVR